MAAKHYWYRYCTTSVSFVLCAKFVEPELKLPDTVSV